MDRWVKHFLSRDCLASTIFYIKPCSRTAGMPWEGKKNTGGNYLVSPEKEIPQVMKKEVEGGQIRKRQTYRLRTGSAACIDKVKRKRSRRQGGRGVRGPWN